MIYTLVFDMYTRDHVGLGVKEDAMRDPRVNPLGVRVARWEGGRWVPASSRWFFATTPDIHPVDFDFAVQVDVPWGSVSVEARRIDSALVSG